MDCHFQIWREDKVEQIIKSGMGTVRARAGPEARTWPEARVILGQRPISRPPHPARFAPLRGMRGLEIGLWPSIDPHTIGTIQI